MKRINQYIGFAVAIVLFVIVVIKFSVTSTNEKETPASQGSETKTNSDRDVQEILGVIKHNYHSTCGTSKEYISTGKLTADGLPEHLYCQESYKTVALAKQCYTSILTDIDESFKEYSDISGLTSACAIELNNDIKSVYTNNHTYLSSMIKHLDINSSLNLGGKSLTEYCVGNNGEKIPFCIEFWKLENSYRGKNNSIFSVNNSACVKAAISCGYSSGIVKIDSREVCWTSKIAHAFGVSCDPNSSGRHLFSTKTGMQYL